MREMPTPGLPDVSAGQLPNQAEDAAGRSEGDQDIGGSDRCGDHVQGAETPRELHADSDIQEVI